MNKEIEIYYVYKVTWYSAVIEETYDMHFAWNKHRCKTENVLPDDLMLKEVNKIRGGPTDNINVTCEYLGEYLESSMGNIPYRRMEYDKF